jgi:hypothetical protein
MNILSYLKRRKYQRKLADWPLRANCALEVSLVPAQINGLKFQSEIDEARIFGRPDDIVEVDGGGIGLDYQRHGLVLEYEQDRLVYFGIILSPKHDISAQAETAAARASIVSHGRESLSTTTKADDIIRFFGNPTDDDIDEEERVMTHIVDNCIVESEFTLNNELKRFNVFPE